MCYCFSLLQNLMVPKSKNSKAGLLQYFRPSGILLCGFLILMLSPIKFKYNFAFEANKI